MDGISREYGQRVDHMIIGRVTNEEKVIDLTGFMRGNAAIADVNVLDLHALAAISSAHIVDERMPPPRGGFDRKKDQFAYLDRARGDRTGGHMPMISFTGNTLPGGIKAHMPFMLNGTTGIFWPKSEDKQDQQTIEHSSAVQQLREAGIDPGVFQRYIIQSTDDILMVRHAHLIAAAVNFVLRNRHLQNVVMWIQGVRDRHLHEVENMIRKEVTSAFELEKPQVVDGDDVINNTIGWPQDPDAETPWWIQPDEVHAQFFERAATELLKASRHSVVLINPHILTVQSYVNNGGVIVAYVEMLDLVHKRRIATRDPGNMQPTAAVPLDPEIVAIAKAAGAQRLSDIHVPKGVSKGMILAPSGAGKSYYVTESRLLFDAPIVDAAPPVLEQRMTRTAAELIAASARADHSRSLYRVGRMADISASSGPMHAFPSPSFLMAVGGEENATAKDYADAKRLAFNLNNDVEVLIMRNARMRNYTRPRAIRHLYVIESPYLEMVPITDFTVPRVFYYVAVTHVDGYDMNARMFKMISYVEAYNLIVGDKQTGRPILPTPDANYEEGARPLYNRVYECRWVYPHFNTRPSGIGGLVSIHNRNAYAIGRSMPFLDELLASNVKPSGHALAALPLSPGPFLNYLMELLYNFHHPASDPFPFGTVEPSTGETFHSTAEYQAAIDILSSYHATVTIDTLALRVVNANATILKKVMSRAGR
uniref:Uncharacterized protein n=1 Tax=viral metagenome TaxID=1070528 RepID=A0A2V0RA76_9ZZZZ